MHTAAPNTWDLPPAELAWDSTAPDATWDSTHSPPPQPKPKKKPFRRKAKPQNPQPPTPNNIMSTFKYNTAPNPQGGFTTRAVLGEQIVETDLTAMIATAAAVTPAQAELVIKTLFAKLLECSTACGWSPGLYDIIRVRPTCGGSNPAPDGFHNPDDINADVSLSYTRAAIDAWRAGLSIESMGEVGLITPIIDTIIDITTGTPDHYTAANMIQLRGDYLRFTLADPLQGTFFRSGTNPEVRGTLYGQNEPGIVSVAVPAALSGPLQVRHAATINGSIRSYTYTHLIS